MCGRASLDNDKIPSKHRFKAKLDGVKYEKNFNLCPQDKLPVILPGKEKAEIATWALTEKEPDGTPNLPFNVKSENLLIINRFRALLAQNRCIIPIDGFFEWKEIEEEPVEHFTQPAAGSGYDMFGNPILSKEEKRLLKSKKAKPPQQKYRIALKNEEPFGVAGLWKEKLDPDTGELTKYFAIITTKANTAVSPYHHRMPVILTLDNEEIWMDNKVHERDLLSMLKPYDSRQMTVIPVGDQESMTGDYSEPNLNSN